jgi:hypothetical protein
MSNPATTRPTIAELIGRDGFAFVHDNEMRGVLEANGMTGWDAFAASWDDLGVDTYMADGGRYRRRRHAVFAATPAGIVRLEHRPHYQSRDYNALNGGVARWFDPVTEATEHSPAFQAILATCHRVFDTLSPDAGEWEIETHQFRIEAQPGKAGQPTPEGMHRDGVDWVLVLMIRRENIASGETTIHDLDRHPLGSFTLARPMDAAWVDDSRRFHGVTPVEPRDPALPAFRDVLVVTFRHPSQR